MNLFPFASVFKESFYRCARSSSLSLLAVCQILWPTIHPGKKENRPFSVAVTDKMERTQERMLNFMPSISIYIRNRIKKKPLKAKLLLTVVVFFTSSRHAKPHLEIALVHIQMTVHCMHFYAHNLTSDL